jgi:hypothetical protein
MTTAEMEKWLNDRGFKQGADGRWHKPKRTVSAVRAAPGAVAKRDVGHAPVLKTQTQAAYPGRVRLCVTSFRCGTQLDQDNICPKYFIDCCRYAGLIRDDCPGTVALEVKEVRVSTKKEEGCLIEIFPL